MIVIMLAIVFSASCLICLYIGYLAGCELGFIEAMTCRKITLTELWNGTTVDQDA